MNLPPPILWRGEAANGRSCPLYYTHIQALNGVTKSSHIYCKAEARWLGRRRRDSESESESETTGYEALREARNQVARRSHGGGRVVARSWYTPPPGILRSEETPPP
jgi:hypothetical protein